MAAPDVIDLGGETLTVVSRSDAELVLDAAWEPGASAPPPHLHPNQDERFEVLEGSLTVVVDGDERVLATGDTLDIPRGTPHRMWNPGDAPARARWTVTPALRTEEFFRAIAAAGGRHASPPAAARVLAAHRDEFRLALPGPVEPVAVRALALVGRALGR